MLRLRRGGVRAVRVQRGLAVDALADGGDYLGGPAGPGLVGGRRGLKLYQVTDAGLAVFLEWLRQPVDPQTVGAELGQHLMRFSLMENYLEHAEVIAFLAALGEALDGFVRGMEQFVAARQEVLPRHALLALDHGIAIHQASLEWVRSAMAALGAAPSSG